MERGVVVAQPQRNRIRRAASFGDKARFERRAGRNHARGFPGWSRDVRRKNHIDFRIARDRSRCTGKDAAEFIDDAFVGHFDRV